MERIAMRPRRTPTPVLGLGNTLDDRIHALEVSASDPDGSHAQWVKRHLHTTLREVPEV